MSKTIFRVEKNANNPFVMIDRRPIENPALSWRAKGILTYLLSRPDNWIVRLEDLVKRSPDGVYAVRAALKELIDAKHVTRSEERENGRFKQYVLHVHEMPLTSPLTNLSQAVPPQAVNLMLNNTDSNTKNKLNDIERGDGQIFKALSEILGGGLNSNTPKFVDIWKEDHSVEWILKAIAKSKKARSIHYVDTVLSDWKENGYPSDETPKSGDKTKSSARQPKTSGNHDAARRVLESMNV